MDLTQEKQSAKFGLKINVSTLHEKEWTIKQVIEALGIDKLEYVIGYDLQLAKEQQPHCHIHWTDSRSLDALQKAKQRALNNWGRTTKLYAAKSIPNGDAYCWYGYACKEKVIETASSIDMEKLNTNAHTQKAFKQSQLNYAANQAEKDLKKQTLEEQVFEKVQKAIQNLDPTFHKIAIEVSRAYMTITDEPIRKSNLEMYTTKYLIKHGIWTHEDLIAYYFRI